MLAATSSEEVTCQAAKEKPPCSKVGPGEGVSLRSLFYRMSENIDDAIRDRDKNAPLG